MNEFNEELISGYLDDELSSAEKKQAEELLAADSSLRSLLSDLQADRLRLRESAELTAARFELSSDFTVRVMKDVHRSAEQTANEQPPATATTGTEGFGNQRNLEADSPSNAAVSNKSVLKNTATMNTGTMNTATNRNGVEKSRLRHRASIRTLVEIIAAAAAVVMIVFAWQPSSSSQPGSTDSQANLRNNGNSSDTGTGQVRMMRIDGKDVDGKGKGSKQLKNGTQQVDAKLLAAASREFSVFVDQKARAEIDRFWIVNDYEIMAPADEKESSVKMFLVSCKRDDAIKFLGQLKDWDSGFSVFQDSGRSGNASWLEPIDVSRIPQAEGDVWTLRIVLIAR